MLGMERTKFNSIYSAISYYVGCKPNRAKSFNIFEPDRGSNCYGQSLEESQDGHVQFGDHPHDKFAAVTIALSRAKKLYNKDKSWQGFELLMLQREDARGNTYLSAEDVAEQLGIARSTFYRHLKEIGQHITSTLSKLGYMKPENEGANC